MSAPVEFPIAAAERAAQLAELTAEIRSAEQRDVARLERELRSVRDRATAAVAKLEREARAVHERLERELLTTWRDAIDELVAQHDGRDRSVARAIGELITRTSARCAEELGVEFHAARHLALAFARREIERRPCAVNRFGLREAWADVGIGPGLYEKGAEVAQAIRNNVADALLLDAINRPELTVARQAAGARGGEPAPYASARFEAMHVGADSRAHGRALEAFEAEWRERERQRQAAELERHRADVRRAYAGDRNVDRDRGPGFFESVRKVANEAFGKVLPVGSHRAVAADDDANDLHLAAIRRVERQAAEAAARKGA